MCWLCNDYKEVGPTTRRVSRLVFEDAYSYVIVPRESHVPHHLIVALKKHKEGLIACSADDLSQIVKSVADACQAFKNMGYNRVYKGCFSDEGHVHYHLFPLIKGIDKIYEGWAIHWLAEKERISNAHPFNDMAPIEQHHRLDQIEIVVAEVRAKWSTRASTD